MGFNILVVDDISNVFAQVSHGRFKSPSHIGEQEASKIIYAYVTTIQSMHLMES